MQKKQLALDTNILFDLAHDKDFAHTFREVLQQRGYSLKVPPTVVQELGFYALRKQVPETPFALKALQNMREWGILPFDLVPTGHTITSEFSAKLIRKGFLPEGEFNDGLILAETSLACIHVLATRDFHILGIGEAYLKTQFDESDLMPVAAFHPNILLTALR